jgi:hypothetical protein
MSFDNVLSALIQVIVIGSSEWRSTQFELIGLMFT